MYVINHENKDKILKLLCDGSAIGHVQFKPKELYAGIEGMNIDFFIAIMEAFRENGLVEDLNIRRDVGFATVKAKAYDFLNEGGFTARYLLFEQSLKKLELEVSELQKQFPEKANTWASILGNIATVAGFLVK